MRRSHKHLYDMLRAGEELQEISAGKTLDDYLCTRLLQLGVERCLITLGEAATIILREDPEMIVVFPELPQIKGLRNRVVHDYDDIDDEVVWKSVTDFLPAFLDRLRPFIQSLL
jgi:uncharacterized protein with HEPN domain